MRCLANSSRGRSYFPHKIWCSYESLVHNQSEVKFVESLGSRFVGLGLGLANGLSSIPFLVSSPPSLFTFSMAIEHLLELLRALDEILSTPSIYQTPNNCKFELSVRALV